MSGAVSDAPQLAAIAQPVTEHQWRICANHPESADDARTVFGYISELGGTYEVRTLLEPQIRQYVPTFKEAMECFGALR